MKTFYLKQIRKRIYEQYEVRKSDAGNAGDKPWCIWTGPKTCLAYHEYATEEEAVADKDKNELKETLSKVQGEIKKNIHLIKIDLNKYENQLRFYRDPASVNYEAFVTREYIPRYCCEEIDINNL